MKPFSILTAIAAPLPIINIDTDMIIPKQFLKTIKRTGLGKNLFDEMRYTLEGKEIGSFILNKGDYRQAGILIAGENFGCGSSREHAPWALLDFGIQAIIAPSFADIFYNNCFKNGILPLVLAPQIVNLLLDVTAKAPTSVTINLPEQFVQLGEGETYAFEIDHFRKYCLIKGLDDIGLTLGKRDKIDHFETEQHHSQPWLYMQGASS